MDGREIEPRKMVWAIAEVCWQEPDGTSLHTPATLEDTSTSGACLRTKRPFAIGSRLTIKWRREQFSAIAKNCRSDGRDFLLGVRRDAQANREKPQTASRGPEPSAENTAVGMKTVVERKMDPASPSITIGTSSPQLATTQAGRIPPPSLPSRQHQLLSRTRSPIPVAKSPPALSVPADFEPDTRSRSERKVMQPKSLIPQFWRRPQGGDAPAKDAVPEVTVNKSCMHASEALTGRNNQLLSYEDIYRAAGIMSPGSGYDIHKIVDMLNSERIRDLAKEVKRASVLMALDAAGIAADDMLIEATRRQNALNAYEAAQRKQLEEFETLKAQENARIEEEMEKIRAHYAERIQKNLDQVAKEKDALRNWQGAMQHESQRIADVIELCGKPQAAHPAAMAAAAGSSGLPDKSVPGADGSQLARPNPLSKP